MLVERPVEVSAELRPWIGTVVVAQLTDAQLVVDMPDPATTLVLRTRQDKPPELVVMGPRTRAQYHHGEPGPACVKVTLQPGQARLVLGKSVRGIVDTAVPLADIWGEPGQRLARHWCDPAEFAKALVAGVSPRPADVSRGDLVRRAGELLSTEDVQGSAKRLHVSERHLRNVFADGMGVPPKHFARINRVRKVLEHAHTRPWSELALAAGYYDHSHMTAEFRGIMGVPPSAYLRGDFPSGSRCP
jgi:AraC-like DNA-binding protein